MIAMASTTHCSRSASPPWRLALAALLVAITAFAFAPRAAADGINTVRANVVSGADGYRLDAEFDIQFSPRLEEAVNRGVALNFVVEFELSKPRWYWFDEKPVQLSQTYKITYTPLLRQYRLSSGAAYQNFTRFDEVVGALSRVRGWPVAESGALRRQGEYLAAIRMRLDTTQLPKPFQLNAVASNDWNLASDWYRWTVNP
ncbi:MAG: DUF4390 domain-containing protein [Betaproteobacteria bacterium]|nr:DUF4390 domain-containing protein [Betaproteobacteria bacterium]